MKKALLILVAMVLFAGHVSAQTLRSVTGSLSGSTTACGPVSTDAMLSLPVGPTDSAASVQLAGTFSGTVTFLASANGGQQWASISGQPWTGGVYVTSATATGGWTFDVAGKTNLCAYISSYTSGAATTTVASGPARANNVTSSVVKTQVDQYVTAGSFTWTKPTGAIAVRIIAIGAGGAGGAGIASTAAGGGGGGGGACVIRDFVGTQVGSTLALVVGAAGVGGSTKGAATASTVTDTPVIVSAGFGVLGIDASSNSGGGGGGGGSASSLAVAANGNPGTQAVGGLGAGGGTGATTGAIGGKADLGGGGGGGGLNATSAGAGGTSACGGGGGGGGASTGTAGAGGVGGQGAAGGTSQGGSATSSGTYTLGGSGGAGGAQTTQVGGTGAAPGGGGGGGGNLANSGGNGAAGAITIISFF